MPKSSNKGYAVKDIRLVSPTGRSIRKASRVYYPDGKYLTFTEKMSKAEAIRQAKMQRVRHPEYIRFGR